MADERDFASAVADERDFAAECADIFAAHECWGQFEVQRSACKDASFGVELRGVDIFGECTSAVAVASSIRKEIERVEALS